MADASATLMEAARSYVASLTDAEKIGSQAEVERFARWCGSDREFARLRGHEVAMYAETLTGAVTDASDRAEAVRKFLAYAKKAGYSTSNLGTHLRVRKPSAKRSVKAAATKQTEVSAQEKEALTTELESLKAQRPRIIADLKRAMEDKDFRENAPLDAAKNEQALVEGRIRTLEATIQNAVVVEAAVRRQGDSVAIGTTLTLRNLKSDSQTTYTLVRPGEIDAAQGRISFESPVGRSLLGHHAGDEVEVAAPSGTIRFKIERVEG